MEPIEGCADKHTQLVLNQAGEKNWTEGLLTYKVGVSTFY